MHASLAKLGDELRFVLITSGANLLALHEEQPQGDATELDDLRVSVAPAEGVKCERCWHVRTDVGDNPEYPDICSRCVSNAFGEGESRAFA